MNITIKKPNAMKHHRSDHAYVRRMLKLLDLTQKEAAELVGISHRSMQRIACGDTPLTYPVQVTLELMVVQARESA
jgi:DNA-binding XRE family transcriptional regulator